MTVRFFIKGSNTQIEWKNGQIHWVARGNGVGQVQGSATAVMNPQF